ncbi:MAG: hypothetical protein KUG79_04725 [Pseudomonadales bacterium]|nr:hypothetical protein [Pseudomonadales bacterium]
MAEILGVGITHYPPMLGYPKTYANLIRGIMHSKLVPEDMKQPANWPKGMQEEYDDEAAQAIIHQQRHKEALSTVRQAIDDFAPDAIIIFGDDQYENFKEDVIPPFNMYCMDSFPAQPFTFVNTKENIWGVDPEHKFSVPGAGKLAQQLADGVISKHFPIAYSYKYSNYPNLTHAFSNAMVFLDWEQKGWSYPIIPISVNCYGKSVISSRGGASHLFDQRPASEKDAYLDQPGPAGPTPQTCFNMGATLRQVLEERPERFVVMASSGWSHAFLTEKNHWLYPDRDFDRARFKELESGNHRAWVDLENDAVDDAGCQEFKNWICLSGVLPDYKPEIVDYLETWIFNSQKCFAIFRP